MSTKRYRSIVFVVILFVVVAAAYRSWGREETVRYTTGAVDRGDVVEVVGATGTLEAVTTVQIGSQVSGTIQDLYADFNSKVKKGEVVARLDPSLFEARLGQARANLLAAQANVDRARATVDDMHQKYQRATELAEQKLLPATDLETAKANDQGAVAQLKASEAAETQAQASVNQAELDLSHTVIATPIDGVVISRNVDVGQTVAASFQAPVLFVIANDLAQMQVNAAVDEADVGRVREGQEVTFRVDAYPEREFQGRVVQVRLDPTTESNVVSYNTIVTVDNQDLLLRPGMTATVSIEVHAAKNALRLPAAALRFRPEGASWSPGPAAWEGAGGGGSASSAGVRSQAKAEGGGRGKGRPATVYVPDEKGQPRPVEVRVGVSDGQFVELRDGLDEGAAVITGTAIPGARMAGTLPQATTSPTSNPFTPHRPARRER